MRAIKRILVVLFFTLLFLAGTGIILFQVNKNKIKQQILVELNEELSALVDVKEITFDFFRHFPNITANFKQVTIFSPEDFSSKYSDKVSIDTLLNVNNIYFNINSIGLIKKEIIFNSIILNEGWLNIILNEKGINNYQIFKSKKNNESQSLTLNFKSVLFKNLFLEFHDLGKGLVIKTLIDEHKTSIKNNNSFLKLHTKITIHEILSKGTLILSNKSLTADVDLSIKDKVFTISAGNLDYSGVRINISGTLEKKDNLYINWHINSSDNKVKNLIQLIPESIQKKFKALKVEGNLALSGTINGILGNNKYPHINFNFNIKQGMFYDPKTNLKFTNITASGDLDNGKQHKASSTVLKINSFQTQIGGETIHGTYQLRNLEKPEIKITTTGTFKLEEFKKLIPDSNAEILNGYARVNVSFTGKLKRFKKISLHDLEKFNPAGQIELVDVNFKSPKRPIVYSSISGNISLGEHFQMHDLSLSINNNPITMNGEVRNVLSYLNQKKKALFITGNVESPNFDLKTIIPVKENRTSGNKTVSAIHLPKYIDARIKLHAEKLSYRKFHTENFKGSLLYSAGSLLLDNVSFNSMDGQTNGSINIFEQSDTILQMHVSASVNNIDIHKLFFQMGNFGQTFIRDENLEGKVSGNVKFYSEWSSDLKMDKKSIIAESKYLIENGKLVNFEPIQKLSGFIAVEELKDINFSRLENDVFIKNEIITIPLMEINSSAFNIEASGIHYFDKHYDYKIWVLLSEILASKANRNKKENKEFGIIEDDGLGKTAIPLRIIGDQNDLKVSYDRKGMTKNIKTNLKNERQNLKQLFNEEFGKRKMDSTSLPDKKETKKFNITWEEEELPDTSIKK